MLNCRDLIFGLIPYRCSLYPFIQISNSNHKSIFNSKCHFIAAHSVSKTEQFTYSSKRQKYSAFDKRNLCNQMIFSFYFHINFVSLLHLIHWHFGFLVCGITETATCFTFLLCTCPNHQWHIEIKLYLYANEFGWYQ